MLRWYLLVSLSYVAGFSALNGNGDTVDWWLILKLPQQVQTSTGEWTSAHCPCTLSAYPERGSGLCYLYADSAHPTLQSFQDYEYDCLGQGQRDPLSQTVLQLYSNYHSSFWGMFNDQWQKMAFQQDPGRTCTGESKFNAHSKGFVLYNLLGGVHVQVSTPNFPDFSHNGTFVPLGWQMDNNVYHAQHFFAMSLEAESIDVLGRVLMAARVCSLNFYGTPGMVSPLFHDPNTSTIESSMYQALVNSALPQYPTVSMKLKTRFQDIPILVISKARNAQVVPWALIADRLGLDLTVASWWDNGYGIPSVCANDHYRNAENEFCLVDDADNMQLTPSGKAKYNIENAIGGKWKQYHWRLSGGKVGGPGNHGKWGFGTPRNHSISSQLIFGDLNMEGFPCSHTCAGSQAGRGGTFFALEACHYGRAYLL